jgi:hypothetical protein
MTIPDSIVLPTATIQRVRLLAEAALLRRFNAGSGFADSRIAAQLYCRDPAMQARIASGQLRSLGTHRKASDAVENLLIFANIERRREVSRLLLLIERFGLDDVSRDIVEVCLAWETDLDTRDLVHALAGRRLDLIPVEIVADILSPERNGSAMLVAFSLLPGAPLRLSRILNIEGEGLGAAIGLRTQSLRWLFGEDSLAPPLAGICELLPMKVELGALLPDSVYAAIERLTELPGAASMLIALRGPKGSGRRAAASIIATRLRKRLLVVPLATTLRQQRFSRTNLLAEVLSTATLLDAIVYFAELDVLTAVGHDGDNGEHEHSVAQVADLISTYRGAILVSAASRAPWGLLNRALHEIVMPPADLGERISAWRHALRGHRKLQVNYATLAYADELGARYVLGPGAIAEIVEESAQQAEISQQPVDVDVIEAAVARRLTMRLGSFGSVVARKAKASELIVPDEVRESLQDMIAMVRQRSKILETWGFARHLGISRGVSALLSGEPGTGKTMAASVVASELGLELIRIDLSAVVSKYVGETEKNLSKIFDEAQQSHAMLLFDEADSLFGKRTELRSAQDRFANLEVNYILQRMETFDGISVLTTNAENAIDPALQRRINFRIRFPAPEPAERELLWKSLLPPTTELIGAIDFATLAERFEMTGGYIKNAIVRAAVFAARAGRGVMAEDIYNGAHAEYAEMGKVMPHMGIEFGLPRGRS